MSHNQIKQKTSMPCILLETLIKRVVFVFGRCACVGSVFIDIHKKINNTLLYLKLHQSVQKQKCKTNS